jgi:hypothetical protein
MSLFQKLKFWNSFMFNDNSGPFEKPSLYGFLYRSILRFFDLYLDKMPQTGKAGPHES